MTQNQFAQGNYQIIPIRYEDRVKIMQWRNEQMYHLRQAKPLTQSSQDNYFKDTIAKLFEEESPNQILFSYLKDDELIGYGGLVHINWEKKSAEVSFIMNTSLEKNEFELHWSNYLLLVKDVAFQELHFDVIFTYAFDLRPRLYPILEKNGFNEKQRIKNKIIIDGKKVDVLIHECRNSMNLITLREIIEDDMELIFSWSNDPLVRSQSFNSNAINFEEHKKWFKQKVNNKNSLFLINEYENTPAGLVRFDIEDNYSIIGILISKNYRGKGLSNKMLKKSVSYYFNLSNKPVLAYIKETNKRSIRGFEKAGFIFVKNTLVNEISTFVYKKEKNE